MHPIYNPYFHYPYHTVKHPSIDIHPPSFINYQSLPSLHHSLPIQNNDNLFPQIQAQTSHHAYFLSMLKNDLKRLQEPGTSIYLLSLLQTKRLTVQILQILCKQIQMQSLATHQVSYLKDFIMKNYPLEIDYVIEYEKIKMINEKQIHNFVRLLQILASVSFSFEEYVERLLNWCEVVNVRVLDCEESGEQFEDEKDDNPLFKLFILLQQTLSQQNFPSPPISFTLKHKIFRFIFNLIISPITPRTTQIITLLLKYIQNSENTDNALVSPIIEHVKYQFRRSCRKLMDICERSEEQAIMKKEMLQQINDRFCIKILRIIEFDWWDTDSLQKFVRFIGHMGLASGCNNRQALEYTKQRMKQVKKKLKNKKIIVNHPQDLW